MVFALHNGLSDNLSTRDPMPQQSIEQMLIQAEARFLKGDELEQLQTYVQGWASRKQAYQTIREREASLVQQTLTLLQRDRPDLSAPMVEICRRDLLLIVRQSALSMLLADDDIVQERVIPWIEDQLQLYPLQTAYEAMIRILNAQLKQQLGSQELDLLRVPITQVQVALLV